ncbi:hypothetical protein [Natranaerobius trueperi]|uniref:DUF340 domain-containing protein n=1 Tax=Natranaerobius trueperi TaxID=759412 RepID=A0A226BZ51_9FIRM|nr:hypothetical protein [Natranaerobius trueperi]OWZ84062.1 hypothetical protein CDO51_04920 [Natranaerobius trueperi]
MKASKAIIVFLIVSAITLIGNWLNVEINPIEALPGMLLLAAFAFVGWWISETFNRILPPIVFVSLIAILFTTPWTPGSEWVVDQINNVAFLATTTPVLAYAGISIGQDIDKFTAMGWRIIVLGFVVLTSTFVGSAIVAHIALNLFGII